MEKEQKEHLLKEFDKLVQKVGSQAKACRLVGISPSIMTPLRKGEYGGAEEKQYEILANYFQIKEEAKAGRQAETYVPTSISESVYAYIRNAQIKGGLLAISGAAGIGKTRAIRKYAAESQGTCLWITANPCLNTVKPILKKLCKELNIANVRTNDDMYIAILEKLRDGMVLVFDEAQHLSLKVIETLRGFSDYFLDRNMTLGIVFVGNSTTITRFGGRQDAVFEQIANRTIQKPVFQTLDIRKKDIQMLYPELTDEKSIDFMLKIAQSREAIRGANNLFSNAYDNENITYEGLVSMAKHMHMMI